MNGPIMQLREADYPSSRRALPASELFLLSATCELAVLQRIQQAKSLSESKYSIDGPKK